MTKIVKSSAVVDERSEREQPQAALDVFPVIKRGILDKGLAAADSGALRGRQSYLDELNRVKVDIVQSKAELRTLRRELEEAEIRLHTVRIRPHAESGEGAVGRTLQEQAGEEAEEILAKAHADALREADALKNQGYLEGFHKGYEEAKAEYIGENQPKADQLSEILGQMSTYERRMAAQNERELVQLALMVARKIIFKEIAADPRAVAGMLYDALEQNRREEYIKITLSKDLLPLDAKASEEVRSLLAGMGVNITVHADDELEPGACVVETPRGITDVSISTQLNNIGDALLVE